MQNNVTDLSQKLQRSLDNNYNVIDMPAVIEIISALEKTSVTKELLETTRLAKYINELRRRTSNESLAKRAKELLKKWRDSILPDANGQIKSGAHIERSDSPAGQHPSRKRSARTPPDSRGAKRATLNGQSRELDFSDNSNCSVKDFKKTDVIFINSDSNSSLPDHSSEPLAPSHSNDTLDLVDCSNATPKKRGRKKGSKNHKNLLIAAEESFSNKMAVVSRNSKVKTTQELLADLQNRTTALPKASTHQDIELRAAQLTESLSRIDQKLNPQKQINKNVTPIRNDRNVSVNHSALKTAPHRTITEIQSWSSRTSSPEAVTIPSDDEIVDVVGTDPPAALPVTSAGASSDQEAKKLPQTSEPLTVEGLLSLLPAIDHSCLEDDPEEPPCVCPLPPVADVAQNDRITVQIVGENSEKSLFAPPSPLSFDNTDSAPPEVTKSDVQSDWDESGVDNCEAKSYLRAKYLSDVVTESKVDQLHSVFLPNVNGNWGAKTEPPGASGALLVDIVPRLGVERLPKHMAVPLGPQENFQKYSISIEGAGAGDSGTGRVGRSESCDRTEGALPGPEFREWHETVDVLSYNDELLRILPYVIID